MISRVCQTLRCRGYRKTVFLVALLIPSIALSASSPEDDYLAARDRHIAALAKIENAKDAKARDIQYDKAVTDLEQKLRSTVGPVSITGFSPEGKLNLDSLFADDQGFGMLDGLVYGEHESDKNLVATTDGLLDKWLLARRADDPSLAAGPNATAAVKTEIFYTWAVSTGTAVVHYAEIPVVVPPGAKFAYATLSARTQDGSPDTPDQIFVSLERRGRVFIVNEKLDIPMAPIAACKSLIADYAKRAAADDKAYVIGGLKNTKLTDEADKLRNEGDAAFRACIGNREKDTPQFKSATDQVAAVVAALMR